MEEHFLTQPVPLGSLETIFVPPKMFVKIKCGSFQTWVPNPDGIRKHFGILVTHSSSMSRDLMPDEVCHS